MLERLNNAAMFVVTFGAFLVMAATVIIIFVWWPISLLRKYLRRFV